MSQLWRSRVLRDEDEPGLVGVPTCDWRACSLARSARVGSIGTTCCRAADIARFWDLWACMSFRDMREVSSGLYREGLDLPMRDVARRRVACTAGSVSSTNTSPKDASPRPGHGHPGADV